MPSSLRRNLRLCTLDGLTSMPIVYLLQPGNLVVAALLTGFYELSPATYGLVVSLPFWCNFLQIGVAPLVSRLLQPKAVAVVSAAAGAIAWSAVGTSLWWLPRTATALSGHWFIAFFAVLGMTGAFATVGWTSWVQEWIPEGLRGKYFGVRNQLLQVATVAFLLSVGWLFQLFHRSALAFQVVIFACVGLRVASVLFQQQTMTTVLKSQGESKLPWSDQFKILPRSFFWFVGFGAVWGFAANCIGPFYTVFMYQQLGMSVNAVSWLAILSGVGGALTYPVWGKLADRFGNKPVMIFSLVAWQLQNLLWCFLTPRLSWLLYGMWLFGGLVSAGFILGLFNIQLKLIPPEAKTLSISFNLAITSLVTAVAPIFGGWLLGHLLESGADPLKVYHGLFLIQPVVALLGSAIMWRVHEPQASPLISVVGAMRNVRTLAGIFGLTFLINFVFVKNPKRYKAR
jgi:MFS family permease